MISFNSQYNPLEFIESCKEASAQYLATNKIFVKGTVNKTPTVEVNIKVEEGWNVTRQPFDHNLLSKLVKIRGTVIRVGPPRAVALRLALQCIECDTTQVGAWLSQCDRQLFG